MNVVEEARVSLPGLDLEAVFLASAQHWMESWQGEFKPARSIRTWKVVGR